MAKHSRNTIHSIARSLRLSDEQIESIDEVFEGPQEEFCEFTDIAWKLHELINLAGSDPFGEFDPDSRQYEERHRLALLFIKLLERERDELSLRRETEDSDENMARKFVEKNRSLFESEILSAFILEAGSDFFKECMRTEERLKDKGQGEKSSLPVSYNWLCHIFEMAGLYDKLQTYYARAREKKAAESFFLKFFLLYSSLAPAALPVLGDITYILTKNDRLGDGAGPEALETSPAYSRKKDEKILSILREYAGFIPKGNLTELIEQISKRLSARPGCMAAGSLDILIGYLAEKEKMPRLCLRMRYIDAAILENLCRTKDPEADELEYEWRYRTIVPERDNGRVAFITKKNLRLIRLDADEGGVNMAFRHVDVLTREEDGSADWGEQLLKDAAGYFLKILDSQREGSTFLFSYVYFRNYRTIEEVKVSFDHRYALDDRTVKKITQGLSSPYFYGSHIYSLTCLVGRNGAGKSSLVDFLRESFLAVLTEAEEGKLTVDNGCLTLSREDMERYNLEWTDQEEDENKKGRKVKKGQKAKQDLTAEFFVIFRVKETDFFLTNMKNIRCDTADGLFPYDPLKEENGTAEERRHSFISGMNFTEKDCALAYFSQFHYPTGMYTAMHNNGKYPFGDYIDRYVRDLSEERFDRRAQVNLTGVVADRPVNESLLHQLVFLLMQKDWKGRSEVLLNAEECARYETLEVISSSSGVRFSLNEYMENEEHLLKAALDSEAFIGPLSSGQHTRIKLLSRLYWCLAGSKPFIENYQEELPAFCERVSAYEASCRNRLGEQDTGVLFFDEGDLCYHPEWQRTYLSDIVHMTSALRKKDVQIIVTTNSPFMLSDILSEDVFYLKGVEKADPRRNPFLQTYGQNIHMLLDHRFFMDNTMGKMSEDTLILLFKFFSIFQKRPYQAAGEDEISRQEEEQKEEMLREIYERFGDYLTCRERMGNAFGKTKSDEMKVFLEKLIGSIGERTYRVALKDKYERCFPER